MKSIAIVTLALVALFTTSFHIFGSPLDKQILNLQPKADENGDGKLSKTEQAALKQRIMKRFPRSDSNGDGELSEKELQVVIRIATARAKNQGGRKSGKENAKNKDCPLMPMSNTVNMSGMFSISGLRTAQSQHPWPFIFTVEAFGPVARKS